MVEIKERPILFSGEMVRAILDGRKTQTRRVVKPQPADDVIVTVANAGGCVALMEYFGDLDAPMICCPYGQPGDRLWVRETWTQNAVGDYLYCADWKNSGYEYEGVGWKPSIHMRREASRLTLEVVSVRVERVNAISEDDAYAEGVTLPNGEPGIVNDAELGRVVKYGHYQQFATLWDKINGQRDKGKYAWARNPWVWVVEFKRVAP